MITKNSLKSGAAILALTGFLTSCNNSGQQNTATASVSDSTLTSTVLKEQTVSVYADGDTLICYVAYNDSIKGKRPAVLVIPEWWGMTEYPRKRARMLAHLGYVGMAVDLYGKGKAADSPSTAMAYSAPFYKDPEKAKIRIDSAIAKLKTLDVVDPDNIGAIGYCFGGGMLLNTVRLGDDLKGVVSFHGSLLGTPARKDLLRTKILVCHGNADQFVTAKDVAEFKKQMDSIGASYTFIGYDGATHAFTNPDATAIGEKFKMPIAYNAKADTASWNAMKVFFASVLK
ncbi:MAG TPA: dienelactone hydrolase family protein [Puia sp.]|nr:dienelactone hydrolase family protein [Puia sp.]